MDCICDLGGDISLPGKSYAWTNSILLKINSDFGFMFNFTLNSIESRLQEECLRMAMDIDQLADVHDEEFDHDEEDENDRRDKSSWLAPRFQCLNFSQLTMNCYHASLEFERVLRRILQV